MREVIIPFIPRVIGEDGHRYRVRVIGTQRGDGVWEGRLEFSHEGVRLLTGVETTQRTNEALEEWATALDPVFVERSWLRARPGSRRNTARPLQDEWRV